MEVVLRESDKDVEGHGGQGQEGLDVIVSHEMIIDCVAIVVRVLRFYGFKGSTFGF
jgi:hypothetical protein